MAWELDYARKRSKEAAKHLRSAGHRDAVAPDDDRELPTRGTKAKKRFGVRFYYKALFCAGEDHWTRWYANAGDREKAIQAHLGSRRHSILATRVELIDRATANQEKPE